MELLLPNVYRKAEPLELPRWNLPLGLRALEAFPDRGGKAPEPGCIGDAGLNEEFWERIP